MKGRQRTIILKFEFEDSEAPDSTDEQSAIYLRDWVAIALNELDFGNVKVSVPEV